MDFFAVFVQVLTIVLTAATGYIVWLMQQQRVELKKREDEQKKAEKEANEKNDANAHGTMLLLRVQMIDYHDKYCERGSIPAYAFENFDEMYHAYKSLGGNGMIEKMYKEIQELDVNGKKEGEGNEVF